jgi:sugar lactone lactonase YvrE
MLVGVLAGAAVTAGGGVALAQGDDHGSHKGDDHGKKKARVFTLAPDPAGNPEGIAFDKRTRAFYVSITADGAIYRGRLGSSTVSPFIAGTGSGDVFRATGLKVRRGKLYVAGAASGAITVYDLATREAVATFQTGTGGFLNDLVVTRTGDVYVTDSVRPTLWHVTAAQVRAGSGTPQALDVSAIPFEPSPAFNLNGIVALSERRLVVVNSATGGLFRIDLGDDRASIRSIRQVTGVTLAGGDGMLLDRGRLVVVQGNPARLAFVKLRSGARRGSLQRTQTSDKLNGPSTVARAKNLYLVVNADFANSATPFTVAGLPRHK